MKKMSNKKIGAVCGAAAIALIVGSTYSYFTDRADTEAFSKAGSVSIEIEDEIQNTLDTTNNGILNPGDAVSGIDFSVFNRGNKSIDVKDIITLTITDREGNPLNVTDENGQAEYDLYKSSDVTYDAVNGYKIAEGAKPVEVRTVNGNIITYIPETYTLNGYSADGGAVETEEGIDATSKDHEYTLVFRNTSSNTFQLSKVDINIVSQAKQHRNTSGKDNWTTVSTTTATIGGAETAVVPTEDVITK